MLSEEEEAALLAEYGALGVDDLLLTVPAASRFRSDYGDATVFLTGQLEEDDDTDHARHHNVSSVVDPAMLNAREYPLDALVVRHTELLTASAPATLTGALGNALGSLRQRGDDNSSAADSAPAPRTDYAAILRQSRSLEQRTAHIAAGALAKQVDLDLVTATTVTPTATTDRTRDTAGTDQVALASKLLAEAEAALAAPTKVDAASDPLLQARLEQLNRDLDRTRDDAYDTLLERRDVLDEEDNEAEMVDLLRQCVEYQCAWRAVRRRSSDETDSMPPVAVATREEATAVQAAQADTASTPVAHSVLPSPLTLFAFEMELCRDDKSAADAWEEEVVKVPISDKSIASAARQDVFTVTPATQAVLQSIETMQTRDQQQETTVRAVLRHTLDEHHVDNSKREEATALQQERLGLVSLEAFVKRVDAMLPPVREETEIRNRQARATGVPETVTATAAFPAPPPPSRDTKENVAVSLEAVRKAATRELFAIDMAAREARSMREEDTRMQNWMDLLQERREEIDSLLAHCLREADDIRHTIDAEETIAFKELRIAEQRQLLLLQKAQRVRLLKATEQLSQDLLNEHRREAIQIEHAATDAFAVLEQQWHQESAAVYTRLLATYITLSQAREASFARLTVCQSVPAAGSLREPLRIKQKELHPSSTTATATIALTEQLVRLQEECGSGSRLKALGIEQQTMLTWLRDERADVASSLQCARDELAVMQRRILERRHWRPPQHFSRPPTGTLTRRPSPPATAQPDTSAEPADDDATAGLLNAERFRQLQAVPLAAAQADLVRAPQYLYSLSFALDALRDIDYVSVASAELQPDSEEQQQRRRLLSASLRAAELVRDLNMGSNTFESLSLAEFLETFPSLSRLTFTDNRLTSLAPRRPGTGARSGSAGSGMSARAGASSSVRGVAAARESALAEVCRVRELDVSANRIQDLSSIGRLLRTSLTSLRASHNKVTSLQPLSSCASLMHLDVTGNPLTSLSGLETCRLLHSIKACETDICDCAGATRRLHFVQRFYASQSPVAAFPFTGSVCLTLTQVFLNHCRLQSSGGGIPADVGACMPFLSVLHLEGNGLTTVAGLDGCLRLDTLNLAANALVLPDALASLRVCTHLRSLDVRQNRQPPHLLLALRLWFPRLAELNAEAVPQDDQLVGSSSPTESVTTLVQRLMQLRRTWLMRATARRSGFAENTTRLLMHDAVTCDARAQLEVCAVECQARLRAAQDSDDALTRRFAARQRPVLGAYQLSLEEAERGAVTSLSQSLETVEVLTSHLGASSASSPPRDGRLCCVTQCASYGRRARQYAQSRAQETLAEWLYGLILIRRARVDLGERRRRYRESEAFRRETAARRIQPLWRGAVLRSRLRRIVGSGRGAAADAKSAIAAVTANDDDDDEFVKVDDTFDMPDLPDNNMGMLFQKVLGYKAEALPTFCVPQTIPGFATGTPATAGGLVGGNSGRPDVLRLDDDDEFSVGDAYDGKARAGTAPLGHDGGTAQGLKGKRVLPHLSDPARPSSTLMVHGRERAETPAEALEAQWGTTVAAQIRKKNKKMQSVHQQHVREQFMRDPLGAKKQQRTENNPTKTTKPPK